MSVDTLPICFFSSYEMIGERTVAPNAITTRKSNMHSIKTMRLVILCSVICISYHPANADRSLAQETGIKMAPTVDASSADQIAGEIQRTKETLAFFTSARTDELAAELSVTVPDIEKRLMDLSVLKSAYERLLHSHAALDKIEQDKRSVEANYEIFRMKGMQEKPPYTLTFLDTVVENLSAAERNLKTIDLSMELLRQEVAEDADRLKTIQKELRKTEEKPAGTGRDSTMRVQWEIDGLNLQQRYLQTVIQAKENEIQRYELEKDIMGVQIALSREQSDLIRSKITYNSDDLKRQMALIQQKKADILKDNQRLYQEQKAVEEKWIRAQQDVERTREEGQKAIAEAYLGARDEWRRTYQVAIELNERAAQLTDQQVVAWQNRYKLVNGNVSPDELESMKAAAEKNMENLGQTLKIQQNYLVGIQQRMSSIDLKLGEEGVDEPIRRHLSVQLDAIRKHLERRLEYQTVILATDQIERRLFSEIEYSLGRLTLEERIADIKDEIVAFWNVEILTVDNQPVTLQKAVTALVILLLGVVMFKFLLSMVYYRFLLKSQLKETTASAVHKALTYSAYLLVFLLALRMVNIPLTAFAFLGGAVAIGIGFGAQNLINNFISGFMILGERPINIGDLIEVDGVLGMVEEIGTRCTRVRTGENIYILVPNSTFLERNITNWTLSDHKIRANIAVGVAYGSPVGKVRETLIRAAKEVPLVLKNPEPFVLFNDFGDNALVFSLFFWVEITRVIQRRMIESDVRFKIDELFAQEGIVIAFPQRDVHLDTLSPLKITVDHQSVES